MVNCSEYQLGLTCRIVVDTIATHFGRRLEINPRSVVQVHQVRRDRLAQDVLSGTPRAGEREGRRRVTGAAARAVAAASQVAVKTTIEAKPALTTPITVSMTWDLESWKEALRQLSKGEIGRYEAGKVLRSITAAVALMECTYEVPQEIEP